VLDLDAYLERIGLGGGTHTPRLAEVHRAHSTSIPFENLDPLGGKPVSLDPGDLERKLVAERRGGYCFEQNLLLKGAFEALGAEVEMYLARVRMGARPGVVRPRGHLVMGVHDNGQSWLADVGFGYGTLFEPLPFAPAGEHEQLGWRYRVVDDERERVLQMLGGDEGWVDLYGFPLEPVPMIDVETVNWWICTNPRSPFVTGLFMALQQEDGRRVLLTDGDGLTLCEQTPIGATVTPVERSALPDVIESRFGLQGFAFDEQGRPRPAAN
jgi:N-hydroxyarylamine O-acetyltransferase